MPKVKLRPDDGLLVHYPPHRIGTKGMVDCTNIMPRPWGAFTKRFGSVKVEEVGPCPYTTITSLNGLIIVFGGDTWYREGGPTLGTLEDFEAGNLNAYDAYEDVVGGEGADHWELVTAGVPEGTYALVCTGSPATVHTLLHKTGVTPRGYEYRFTVRRVADEARNDLLFLFAVQDVLNCYALHVDLYYGKVSAGQYENSQTYDTHGTPVDRDFDMDEDVEVFVRWDSDGLLTYGTDEGTDTYQTTLGYTTGTWGWRYLDTAPVAADCPRRDLLVLGEIP